jgi:hypothetical protein
LLNTPTAVLGVAMLIVVVNGLLFFVYYEPRIDSHSSSTPIERAHPKTNIEETTTSVTETPPEKPPEKSF